MKLQFLGAGSGLCSPKEDGDYHSNMVFIAESIGGCEKYLGFDCGVHWQISSEEAGYKIKDFDGFYVSHLHDDHAGCLGIVAFSRYFGTFPFGSDKPKLFANTEVTEELWGKYLAASLESIQDNRNCLDQYFEVDRIKPNGSFKWMNTKFDTIQTVHVVDDRKIKPSYGLIFDTDNISVFISGDTQYAPNQLLTFYQRSDVIFQDCELAEYPNSVHAQYHELNKLPENVKKKMWLYHNCGEKPDAASDGFGGFVKKGDVFDFSKLTIADYFHVLRVLLTDQLRVLVDFLHRYTHRAAVLQDNNTANVVMKATDPV